MGKFVLKTIPSGFMFNLKAGNGEIIATSEIYATETNAWNGICSVSVNAPKAAVEDQTKQGYIVQKHPKFEVYIDKAGEFRFRLKATNGEIIAVSEGYTTKANALGGIYSVRINASSDVVKE